MTLEAQANWKVLLDRVIDGQLDGAHMLAGQPLASTIGFGTQANLVTAFSMDLNGNGVTLSNAGSLTLPSFTGFNVAPGDVLLVDNYGTADLQIADGCINFMTTKLAG